MKMNKLISIVMAALLVCSMVVTGCGSRGGNRGNGGADEVEFNGTIDPDSIPEMTITFAHLDATDPNMQSHGIAVYLQKSWLNSLAVRSRWTSLAAVHLAMPLNCWNRLSPDRSK